MKDDILYILSNIPPLLSHSEELFIIKQSLFYMVRHDYSGEDAMKQAMKELLGMWSDENYYNR